MACYNIRAQAQCSASEDAVNATDFDRLERRQPSRRESGDRPAPARLGNEPRESSSGHLPIGRGLERLGLK